MLRLENITKTYKVGDNRIEALRGVSVTFRENEFVSVLGPSGCGKTTLLNIIGGLDLYTSGKFVINGKPTERFRAGDWDTYRNHTIGFVFQSYNLIPHQTVLANVELALTLTGVGKAERRRRAEQALARVGLADQMKKKPGQLSGGQMQRVAIARALVNDPDIVLADEPTGALDSETSVQIMDLLREISKDKLIIMVTHNPELAEKYSTRIIRLLDGKIQSDSNPYEAAEEPEPAGKAPKKPSMSLRTAFGLSLTNLMTKKGRTLITAFAGSIGIIGIALILSLSSGFQNYIDRVQEDTLSSYPITLEHSAVDMSGLMTGMMGKRENQESREPGYIYSANVMGEMVNTLAAEVQENDLSAFKAYIEEKQDEIDGLCTAVAYNYETPLNLYMADTSDGAVQVNPSQILQQLYGEEYASMMSSVSAGSTDVWKALLDNEELLSTQYEVLSGHMPEEWNEAVLIVSRNLEVSDMTLYALGLKDPSELEKMMAAAMKGESYETEESVYSYADILATEYKLLPESELYAENKTTGLWEDRSEDAVYMKQAVDNAETVKIVGIVCPAEGSTVSAGTGTIGYLPALMTHLIEKVNDSDAVKAQKASPDTDIFTGIDFDAGKDYTPTMEDVKAYVASLPAEEQAQVGAYLQSMTEEEILAMFEKQLKPATTEATYAENLKKLGSVDIDDPTSIYLYPKDFESKEALTQMIEDYNNEMTENGEEGKTITYTDYIGILLSSVSDIINGISYVLIAFVAISLVVSSIMIGIITYISVLERTKEIGILRAIGASRRDVARVFNAETLLEGLTAGAIGIGVTLLLLIPINLIIDKLANIGSVAALPWQGGVALVCISMLLTFIAGLIPSRMAAQKDPVVALRSE